RRHEVGEEPDRKRFGGPDPSAPHDQVFRAAEANHPREPLSPAAPRDHPDFHLGEAELDVVGGDAEVTRERELEPDAEDKAAQLCNHRLRAPLRSSDVPGQARELLGLALEETGDVAARGEGLLACSGENDRAYARIAAELLEELRELIARRHREAVQ